MRRLLAAAAAAGLMVVGTAVGAAAVDGTIVNIDRTTESLQLSVDVPADATVDLAGVTATVEGESYPATAQRIADGASRVQRTTVLAIDTSNSMQGERFVAAKLAATTFLTEVPADVLVGIVSFDSDVQTELEPTTDRALAEQVVADLALSQQTRLFEGVIAAVDLTGTTGQRSVLVLSDGADTSGIDISEVTTAIDDSDGVVVDVVALEQSADAAQALSSIAGDSGDVITSDSAALSAAFTAEAEVLARQIAVTIEIPADLAAEQVDVAVVLPSSAGDVTAQSFVPALEGVDPGEGALEAIPQTAAPSVADTPPWLIYAGVGILGIGLMVALVLLVPAKAVPMSAEDRVSTYTASTFAGNGLAKSEPETAITQQASDAIAGVLDRNKGLDERIAKRLEAAGSELKSSEWLLIHAGLFAAVTVVGLLLGRGSVGIGVVFMILGVVGPWIYLGLRGSRRRKAFDASLPETLQLMSGSLSAGLSLMQSIDTIVREGNEPMASAFRRVLVETRIGIPLEDALEGIADRFDSRDFRWVVMAIKIQRQVGGNLAELLNTVAATMREREYMRRQVAALAAEGKLSAIVLGALPPLFLLYLVLTQGDYVEPLFNTPIGLAMLAGAATWLAIGVFWMSRLIKVEV